MRILKKGWWPSLNSANLRTAFLKKGYNCTLDLETLTHLLFSEGRIIFISLTGSCDFRWISKIQSMKIQVICKKKIHN